MSLTTKVCTKCGENKTLDLFQKSKRGGYSFRCKSCISIIKKLYYSANIEKNRSLKLVSYYRNKEKILQKRAEYYEKNKEVIKARNVAITRRLRQTNPTVKIASNVRTRLRYALKKHHGAESMESLLGCTMDELKLHLESQFTESMSWNNYSHSGWHIDHIRPLCEFDLSDPLQLAEACHYTNLRPLWSRENMRRSK